jgi:hypothetical protein
MLYSLAFDPGRRMLFTNGMHVPVHGAVVAFNWDATEMYGVAKGWLSKRVGVSTIACGSGSPLRSMVTVAGCRDPLVGWLDSANFEGELVWAGVGSCSPCLSHEWDSPVALVLNRSGV